MMKCPKCKSVDVFSCVIVRGTGTVHLNKFKVDEVHEADCFEFDPEDVEDAFCMDCDHEWKVKTVVINGEYQFKG